MSTYLELVQEFLSDTGISGTISSVVGQSGKAGKAVGRVAQADVDIQRLWHDWAFLASEDNTPYSQTLTIGDATYTKPLDLGVWDKNSFIIDRTTDTYQRLTPLDYGEWRDHYRNGTQTNSTPSRVVISRNNDIILWPPPDAASTLTAEYFIRPTKMTANIDVSPIPEQFHRIIVVKAKLLYAGDDEASHIYATAQSEYDDLIDELEAYALPDQGNRRKARGADLTVVPQ